MSYPYDYVIECLWVGEVNITSWQVPWVCPALQPPAGPRSNNLIIPVYIWNFQGYKGKEKDFTLLDTRYIFKGFIILNSLILWQMSEVLMFYNSLCYLTISYSAMQGSHNSFKCQECGCTIIFKYPFYSWCKSLLLCQVSWVRVHHNI